MEVVLKDLDGLERVVHGLVETTGSESRVVTLDEELGFVRAGSVFRRVESGLLLINRNGTSDVLGPPAEERLTPCFGPPDDRDPRSSDGAARRRLPFALEFWKEPQRRFERTGLTEAEVQASGLGGEEASVVGSYDYWGDAAGSRGARFQRDHRFVYWRDDSQGRWLSFGTWELRDGRVRVLHEEVRRRYRDGRPESAERLSPPEITVHTLEELEPESARSRSR